MRRGISKWLTGVALAAGWLVAGCGHKDALAGTWTGTTSGLRNGTANTRLVLTDDGKDTVTTEMVSPRGTYRIDGSGTYTISGDTLTQTFTTLTFNGRPVPQSKGPVAEPSKFNLDGDTLTLTNQRGVTQVLTRQKS